MGSNIASAIKTELKKQSDPEIAEIVSGYFKTSRLQHYGVKIPVISKTTKKFIKGVPIEILPEIMKELWKDETFETRRAAIDVMMEYSQKGDPDNALKIIDTWIDDIDTWGTMDPLGSNCLGALLLRDEKLDNLFKKWAKSDNFWRRRASMLPYLRLSLNRYHVVSRSSQRFPLFVKLLLHQLCYLLEPGLVEQEELLSSHRFVAVAD